jgi:hypothetical protein
MLAGWLRKEQALAPAQGGKLKDDEEADDTRDHFRKKINSRHGDAKITKVEKKRRR